MYACDCWDDALEEVVVATVAPVAIAAAAAATTTATLCLQQAEILDPRRSSCTGLHFL